MNASFERLPLSKSEAIVKAGVKEFSEHSYADANTDRITSDCGISKGLLYHYFGTKKAFYLYCLRCCLELLSKTEEQELPKDFYAILFAGMERKMQLCTDHPAEMKMLNMASREFSKEVKSEKDELLARYAIKMRTDSKKMMSRAVSALELKSENRSLAEESLNLYAGALINRYLLRYQEKPEMFFACKETIKEEMKSYMDRMLYGICEEKK